MARRLWGAAIFAANLDDAARALGYLHASERLYQMEINRRVGQGRAAEIAGADFVGVDRFTARSPSIPWRKASFAALSPWAQKRLTAYADGVNAFLDSHRNALPPEFLILGDKPEPWAPADSLVWGKLMSLQLSSNYTMESLRARLAQKLPADRAGWLFPGPKADGPVTTAPAAHPDHAGLMNPRPARRAAADEPRRLERMGRRRGAQRHRQTDPRQRSAPRARRADLLVSRAHRHAAGSRSRAQPYPGCRSSCSARATASPGA